MILRTRATPSDNETLLEASSDNTTKVAAAKITLDTNINCQR